MNCRKNELNRVNRAAMIEKKRIRIIFVTITFDPEPAAQRGLPLARWLQERGYEVRVLTGFPQWPIGRTFDGYRQRLWMREKLYGVQVLRVPLYPSHDTNPIKRIATYLSFMISATLVGVPLIGRGDIIYLYEPPPTNGIPALLLSRLYSAPIVHHIADMWPETVLSSGMLPSFLHRITRSVIGAYCRFLYRKAAVVSVLSPGFGRLVEERGVSPNRILLSYNWADEYVFSPEKPSPALRSELGFNGRIAFVYAGNIGPMQGIDIIVQAAAIAGARDPRILVVIIGTGPAERDVRALAATLKTDSLVILPRKEYREMSAINAVSDVLIAHLRDFDFLSTTIPSKVSVALACARPQLLGARGDAAELVRKSGGGVVCAPDDPHAMAQAMIHLASLSSAEREAMGRLGRVFYEKHLSIDVAGARLDAVFRDLTKKNE